MNKRTLKLWTIACFLLCILIYYLEGILFNPFAIWNFSPLLISYLLLKKSINDNSKPVFIGFILFSFISLTLLLLGHLAWYFDWQQTKTGSSTSAIIFIFLPVYSIILGGIGYLSGVLTGKLICKYDLKS